MVIDFDPLLEQYCITLSLSGSSLSFLSWEAR